MRGRVWAISFNTYLDFFNNLHPAALWTAKAQFGSRPNWAFVGYTLFLRLFSLAGRTPLCCGATPPSKSGDFVGAVDEFHLTFGVIADTGKAAVVLGNIDGGLHPGG